MFKLMDKKINDNFMLKYTVRHKLSIASIVSRKGRKLSSHEYFLVLFIKIDKLVTIYSKFRFAYHKGKQPGMVNAY